MDNEIKSDAVALTDAPLPTINAENIDVVAETPEEMRSCQEALIQWARAKVAATMAEAKELREAVIHAKERKWKSGTLERHAILAEKRTDFYQKILVALEHGYQIVPSFPITAFAVRRSGNPKKPTAMFSVSTRGYSYPNEFKQETKAVPGGEGEYFNPYPIVVKGQRGLDEKGVQKYAMWADRWAEMEFPVTMAKPQIMVATSRAMAIKVFDELGICPPDRSKADPMIIGRIRDPRQSYGARYVSFIIAWRLNTADL